MKKALPLAMALVMIISMICALPVVAAAAGNSADPISVKTPADLPEKITIPAHGAVYYKYNANVFKGWSVTAYGVTSVEVDGVVFDEKNHWGEIEAAFNFKFMAPGIVAYINDTDEDLDVKLTHNEPLGTEKNPDKLVDGVNSLSITAKNTGYVADYHPMVSGEYTFSTAAYEGFTITATVDETEYTMENGSLTLELEGHVFVRFVITRTGNTSNIDLVVTAPKAGTEDNPIWLSANKLESTYALSAGDSYFQVDADLTGNILTMTSASGTDFTVLVDGMELASEGGKLSTVLEAYDWYIELIVSSAVDDEFTFSLEYAEGSENNPIVLETGSNAVTVPENTSYYYTYTTESAGLLEITPADPTMVGQLSVLYKDAEGTAHYVGLAAGASSTVVVVPANQLVTITLCGVVDEEAATSGAVTTTLDIAVKELVFHNTFEGAEQEGDLEGWSSESELILEEISETSNVANGLYSAEFNVTLDGGTMFRDVLLEANTNYCITFQAMALVDGTTLIVKLVDNAGNEVQESVVVGTEWAEYTVTFNSGAMTNAVLQLQYSGLATDGQVFWLDDISMTKGPEKVEGLSGDTNGDGRVNLRDVGLLQQYLAGWSVTISEAAADANGDGRVNLRDVGLLQQYLAGWNVTLK